jgi:hypothetical protein
MAARVDRGIVAATAAASRARRYRSQQPWDERVELLGKSGGQGRNRTSDTMIFSHVLYQLSYLAWWTLRGLSRSVSISRTFVGLSPTSGHTH